MKKILILFFLIVSCFSNQNYNDVVEKSFDSDEFDMYVDKFYRDVNNYGFYPVKPEKIIIKFSYFDRIKHSTHLHGVSLGYNDDDLIEIYINKSSWDNLDRAGKFRLMYHELGHDVLNLDDLDETNTELDAIMYPAFSTNQKLKMDIFIENLNTMLESYVK